MMNKLNNQKSIKIFNQKTKIKIYLKNLMLKNLDFNEIYRL